MKLLTKEILKAFKKQGNTSQMDPKDIKIVAKFFNPAGAGTWYATEYDETERIFFGFVSLFNDFNDELGSFSLDELEEYTGPLGIGIERDRYFGEHYLVEVLEGHRP
jgi:hypothetical protein